MPPENRPNPRDEMRGPAPHRLGPAPTSPPRRPGERPPPPPVVAWETVTAACGHPEKFGLFEDRKDKFRKDRRKKVTDRPCKACREKKAQEEAEALAARRAEKQLQAAEAAKAGPVKKQAGYQAERLPDGARFEVVFDGTAVKWAGTLTIGSTVFSGSAGALFTLLNRLDRQYRQSVGGTVTEKEEAP